MNENDVCARPEVSPMNQIHQARESFPSIHGIQQQSFCLGNEANHIARYLVQEAVTAAGVCVQTIISSLSIRRVLPVGGQNIDIVSAAMLCTCAWFGHHPLRWCDSATTFRVEERAVFESIALIMCEKFHSLIVKLLCIFDDFA